VRSRRANARQADGAGRDWDLLVPAALFALHGVCGGKHPSTQGDTSEPPLTAAQSGRVCPHTHLGGCGVPAPLAEQGCSPVARVGVRPPKTKAPTCKTEEKELLLLIINEISYTALKTWAILFGKCNEKIN